jgi:hypothetical protein
MTSDQIISDHIIDKVRKLLAKAEGTTNEAEAEAFSIKAAELIAAHRLDPEQLAPRPDDPIEIDEIGLTSGAYSRARLELLGNIADAHGCLILIRRVNGDTWVKVIGHRSDIDLVRMLYTSLHAQATSQMKRVFCVTAGDTRSWRRSFLFGYAERIGELLQRIGQEATETSEHSEELHPILLDRAQRVEEFKRHNFPVVGTMRPAMGVSPGGRLAGRDAADRANLGFDAVGQRGALPR